MATMQRRNRTNQHAGPALLLIALLTPLGACVGGAKAPEVTISGVEVAGIGLRGATLMADVELKNPNDFTIETDSVTYVFEASDPNNGGAWQQVTQGTYNQRIQVRDNSRTQLQIPLEFSYSNMSGAMRSILDRGTFNYRVHGSAFLREPLRRTIPFTKSGNISLQGAR